MIACDNFMNVTLRDVILTAPEGDKFYQMKEVYLKGNVVSRRLVSVFGVTVWWRWCDGMRGAVEAAVLGGFDWGNLEIERYSQGSRLDAPRTLRLSPESRKDARIATRYPRNARY
jgi:hypothetical protein